MSLKIFSLFIEYIHKIINSITGAHKWIIGNICSLIQNFKLMRENLRDFNNTNLRLGKYHLFNKNINDAIFRFWLVEKIFDPDNPEACYYLGWCFMKKGNYEKALEYLEKAKDADKVNLEQFVKNIDSVQILPENIEAILRDILAEDFIDRFINKEEFVPTELINELNVYTVSLPEEYTVLELGSNIGLGGVEIRKKLPEEFNLIGVENSEIMSKLANSLKQDNGEEIYNEFFNVSIPKFLEQDHNYYNLIISLDGFAFTSNLQGLFIKIKHRLAKDGTFAFVTKTNSSTYLDKNLMEFYHDITNIRQALQKSSFEIVQERQLRLDKSSSFSIFIAK